MQSWQTSRLSAIAIYVILLKHAWSYPFVPGPHISQYVHLSMVRTRLGKHWSMSGMNDNDLKNPQGLSLVELLPDISYC